MIAESVKAITAPSAKSTSRGELPGDAFHSTLASGPSMSGAGGGLPAEIEARDLAPVQRDRPLVDVDRDAFGIALPDGPVELIADHQPGLILGRVDLQARGGLGEPDELDLTDDPGQPLRGIARGRRARGDPDRLERPRGPLPVGQLLAIDRDLDQLGAEAERQPVRARGPSQPLDRQGRAVRDSRPRDSPRPSRGRPAAVAGPPGPRNVELQFPPPARDHRAVVAKRRAPAGPRATARRGGERARPRRRAASPRVLTPPSDPASGSGLPVTDHRPASIRSNSSTKTLASPGRWSTAWTPGRATETAADCQGTARVTARSRIARSCPEMPGRLADQHLEEGRQRARPAARSIGSHRGARLQGIGRFVLSSAGTKPDPDAGVEDQPPLDPEASVPLEELAPSVPWPASPLGRGEARERDDGEERRDEATGCGMMSHGSDSTASFSPNGKPAADGTPVTTPAGMLPWE